MNLHDLWNWVTGRDGVDELNRIKKQADKAKARFEHAHEEATDALHELAESDDPLETLVRSLRGSRKGN